MAGCWSRRPDRSCVTPWTRMFMDSSCRTTLSGIPLPRFFTRSHTQRSSGRVKVWKLTLPFPSRDRNTMTEAMNPSVVDGTTINFSPFIWAVRPPGQDARNQGRKDRASSKREIEIGILLARCPACRQAFATWAFKVEPSGLPLRGPDISLDMHPSVSRLRPRILAGPNPWLWTKAAHLAEMGRRSRRIQPRTFPLPRMTRVAGCGQQLFLP